MPKPILSAALKGAAVMLAVFAGTVAAQQPAPVQAYDVELVIFRRLSSSETPELWSAVKGLPPQLLAVSEDENVSEGIAKPAGPVATMTETFPALPAAKYKLSGVADALRRGRDYQPVAHFGWTQPGYPRTEAHYMSIASQASQGLTGRVALSRGRYLHLTLDLVLEDSSGERFILQHTRRMRSTERHYIDHPKFGVVAVVTPSGA